VSLLFFVKTKKNFVVINHWVDGCDQVNKNLHFFTPSGVETGVQCTECHDVVETFWPNKNIQKNIDHVTTPLFLRNCSK
jgi:hypothetical protein